MPFNTYPITRRRSTSSESHPFSLVSTSVDVSSNAKFVSSADFDCGCPCNDFVPAKFITSSKLLEYGELTNLGSSQRSAKPEAKRAIKVSVNSYLFKGIIPPTTFAGGLGRFDSSPTDKDPTIKIYGLNVPIILDGFLNVSQKNNKKTLKIWLTCCYASGNAAGTGGFSACKNKVSASEATLSCGFKGVFPQVAFISAGAEWPEQLATRKMVNKGTDASPLYDKRTIEAHVPIGEVNNQGVVIVQYLKQNLMLMDMCLNGAAVKYPMAIFSESTILPVSY